MARRPALAASFAVKLSLSAAAALLTLLVAEAGLRWGGFGGGAVELHAALLEHDPTLGWRKIPDGRVAYRRQGRRVVETSNSWGGRGAEPRPFGRRALFLGDSFCEGYLVSDDDVFSAVLAAAEPTLSILNLGAAGYSTDQQLLLFREVAPRFRPEATVLLFFDNDVWFNARGLEYRAPKPRFEETPAGELRLVRPAAPPLDRSIEAAPGGPSLFDFRLARLTRRAIDGLRAEREGAAAARQEPTGEFLLYRRDPPPEVVEAWRITELLLERFRAEAGERLTVFYVPNVAAVHDPSWEATKARFSMSDAEWDIAAVERRLAEVCARVGVRFIPTIDAFRRRAAAGETLYFLSDGHWNAAGHRLAAELLRRAIAK